MDCLGKSSEGPSGRRWAVLTAEHDTLLAATSLRLPRYNIYSSSRSISFFISDLLFSPPRLQRLFLRSKTKDK
jgi:hypothetical protein